MNVAVIIAILDVPWSRTNGSATAEPPWSRTNGSAIAEP